MKTDLILMDYLKNLKIKKIDLANMNYKIIFPYIKFFVTEVLWSLL